MLPYLSFQWYKTSLFVIAALILILAGCSDQPQASAPAHVFVSLPAQDSVLRIDPQTGEIVSRTLVGRLPHHMVTDAQNRRLYVTLTGSQAVAELDLDSGALLRTLLTDPVPETRADGSRIEGHFAKNAFAHTSCFDCHRGGPDGVKPVITGSRPFGLLLSDDRKSLLVANTRSSSLARIDLASGQIGQRLAIPASGSAEEPTALAQIGDLVFATLLAVQPSDAPAFVQILDSKTGASKGQIKTGPRANFVLADTRRNRTYVANFETNTVSVYSADGSELEKLTVGPGPQGMQLTPDGSHLLVANYYGNSMSWVRLSDNRVETFPLMLGKQKFSNPSHLMLTSDGKSALVVASGTQGFLVTLDLATKAVVKATPVGPLPFDIAAASAANRS